MRVWEAFETWRKIEISMPVRAVRISAAVVAWPGFKERRNICLPLRFLQKMFRIALRSSSTTFRRGCARKYATISEGIPDGPPATATNREYVYACSEPDLHLLKVLKQPKGDSGRPSVSRKMTVHQRRGPLPVSVDSDSSQPTPDLFLITLDGRPLKTPSGKRLTLPPSKRLLAALVANEWEVQETMIKPHALPLVSRGTDMYLRFSHACSRHL